MYFLRLGQRSFDIAQVFTPILPSPSYAYGGTCSTPMIGRAISHYRVLNALGSGGMGIVYLAD